VADAVFSAAKKHSVKTSTILGIITVESTFDPSSVSSYGAVGLMQVVPRMHRDKLDAVKKQATNVKDNVDVGTQILQEYVSKYGTDRGLVKYSGKATRYGEKVLRASSMKRNQQCPK
jgi:soluble lytic murein transglycosylase-like protein